MLGSMQHLRAWLTQGLLLREIGVRARFRSYVRKNKFGL
jgi:hypothetical protein